MMVTMVTLLVRKDLRLVTVLVTVWLQSGDKSIFLELAGGDCVKTRFPSTAFARTLRLE
jgi:hypothetical protein